ncbi:hypothetical protein ABT214_05955 [Micromonospora purpureochromogenes]|uniref:hypothetical protein n=1 Tax=Micromonospora purpureochromogenes TaxID=47872 RepID=UPI00331F8DD3
MRSSRPSRYPSRLRATALGPCRRAEEARTEAERLEREAAERLELVIAFREQLERL